MRIKPLLTFASTLFVIAWGGAEVASQNSASKQEREASSRVLPTSNVKWQQLNPLRGDKSPKAGTLWGDRIGPGPAGFLLKPIDGFRSPPHIHNIAYRGVVISGLVHNDDPDAQDMWMPAGSFWTQPAGGVHITAAKGSDTLAYIEVEDGFGVRPAKEAFSSDEQPVNVDASNLVWLDASNTSWIDQPAAPVDADGPKIAFLWGNPRNGQLNGTLLKLPAGFDGKIRSNDSIFRAVVIGGEPKYQRPGATAVKALEPGSYFGSKGESVHQVSCDAECIIYVRTRGAFNVGQA